MKVLVTGASGYVGSAVTAALVRAGHLVTGQHHSDPSERLLRELGATPVRAQLGRFAELVPVLAQQDAVIHAAADYQPANDREAIEAMLAGAKAAERPYSIIYTSGVWVLGEQRTPAAEDAAADHPAAAVAWRVGHEQLVLEGGGGRITTAVIRPGMVFGGKGGMFAPWLESAVKEGAAAFVGTGRQHWAYVHREDLAELYRQVLERRGSGIFHGVDGRPELVQDSARAISAAAGKGAVRSIPVEAARQGMGPMADALAMDQVVVSARGREVGWAPRRRGFSEEAPRTLGEWRGASS
jgi:nucleoside-diphosphate-sugar epimerase